MSPVVNAEGRDLRAVSAELRPLAGQGVVVEKAAHLHGFAAGLPSGSVTIEGDAGDYLGVLNNGANIQVKGNAGQYLADNMTRGTVIVEGSAGYGVGAYCYGGTIIVHGDAGDFTAVMNKGATIVVTGSVGDEVGTYMLAGDLVICGNAGKNLGNYLIRGNIYVGGEWASLGHNTRLAPLTGDDVQKLRVLFSQYGVKAEPAMFRKLERESEKPFYKDHKPAVVVTARA